MTSSPLSWIALAAIVSAGQSNAHAQTLRTDGRSPRPRVQFADAGSPDGLPDALGRLLPLHSPLRAPQPGDWLAEHKEPRETYAQYLRSRPVRADRRHRVIYVQPLGEFDAVQRQLLDQTAAFLECYFQLPVTVQEELPLSVIPASARREHPTWQVKQILSTYVLEKVLRPRMPADACAYIALTTSDLWPGAGWNFVFGQASLSERVGVWSIARNGDPHETQAAFRLCLLRTLKTASHETGHMFSMGHCTLYECNMCGSNNREEADRRPLWLCPHCLAKLCYATGADPIKRFEELAAFSQRQELKAEQEFYEKSLDSLRRSPRPAVEVTTDSTDGHG